MARTAEAKQETKAPTVDVVDLAGAKVGTTELPAAWFTGEVKVGVMHQVVTAQLAAARQGSAKTKTRGERRGGGKKPWRQKGTGRARHGSIRSPIWKKGGVAHGRSGQENFTKRVNKTMKRTALRSALTDRANDGNVVVVRGLAFDAPRTKDAVAALGALGHAGRKALVVLGGMHLPTWKSFRNLPEVHLLTVDQLNTYDVLLSDVVVFDENALELIGTGKRADAPESSAPERPEEPEPAVAADAPEETAGTTTTDAADATPADDEPEAAPEADATEDDASPEAEADATDDAPEAAEPTAADDEADDEKKAE